METTSNIKITTTNWRENTSSIGRNEFSSNVRMLEIPKSVNGSCGFNLTRSKWDPYPWVNAVFVGTPAYVCGLKAGDCILEVNGGDVLGLRLADIAKLMHAKSVSVTLLLWNSGCQAKCNDESIFCGPLPRNLTRLTAIVQSIVQLIECPICLDTIMPPTLQCQNGHLVCINCRIRSINCPICRDHFTPRRAKIAEQLHAIITSAFNLCHNEDKLRRKLFGCTAHKLQQPNYEPFQPKKHPHQLFEKKLVDGEGFNNELRRVNKSQEINSISSNMFKRVATRFRTHKNTTMSFNSMENLECLDKPITKMAETTSSATTNGVYKLRNDKNLTTFTLDDKQQQQKQQLEQQATIIKSTTLDKVVVVVVVEKEQQKQGEKANKGEKGVKEEKNKTVTRKKNSVSINDLSELLALGQLSPLKSTCNNNNNNNNNINFYSHEDQRQYVLITLDVPLITVHGTKCVQNGEEMALDVKSVTSSSSSSTTQLSSISSLSLPTCLSQCTDLSTDSKTQPTQPSLTSASIHSNSVSTLSLCSSIEKNQQQ